MSKAEQAHEPTMEEILASIRRIISDDSSAGAKPALGGNAADVAQIEDETDDADAFAQALADDEGPAAVAEAQEEPAWGADDDDIDFAAIDEETAEPAADEDDDVLELTEVAVLENGAAAQEDDVIFQDPPEGEPEADLDDDFEPEPEPEPVAREQSTADRAEALMSADTNASVASAFQSLENFVLSTQSRTLEDLVSDMLKPMIKAWLDVNLPVLVERLVREEIERVSRGRR